MARELLNQIPETNQQILHRRGCLDVCLLPEEEAKQVKLQFFRMANKTVFSLYRCDFLQGSLEVLDTSSGVNQCIYVRVCLFIE